MTYEKVIHTNSIFLIQQPLIINNFSIKQKNKSQNNKKPSQDNIERNPKILSLSSNLTIIIDINKRDK